VEGERESAGRRHPRDDGPNKDAAVHVEDPEHRRAEEAEEPGEQPPRVDLMARQPERDERPGAAERQQKEPKAPGGAATHCKHRAIVIDWPCEGNTMCGMRALVTGGTKGLGLAIARHFRARGDEVVVTFAHDAAAADRVGAEGLTAVRCDVTNATEVDVFFQAQ